MYEHIYGGIDGTDSSQRYTSEDFQLTHGEAIAGMRYIDVPPRRFSPDAESPTIRLVVVDSELYLLNQGSPPDMEPMPESAGILEARRQ